ncbi:DnaJ domain-containing protein [Halenospora varia]|nr:DnaJ domain-containing protein [Halenospora varia]
MPLRPSNSPLALRSVFFSQRFFHASAIQRDSAQTNHYETLQIPTNATPAEVKNSFYALSKTHHPDLNPDDPEAPKRFVKISEAYHVLGIPEKRQKYDREVLPQEHHHGQHGQHHRGSYHSTNPSPAGGRPASGLSRRRTQFRGPPPSFYRSGGWGEQSAKRQSAYDSSTQPDHGPASSANSNYGGMGPGQSPYHPSNPFVDRNHYNREEHLRTHENHDKRLRRRRRAEAEGRGINLDFEGSGSMLMNFLLVGGL